MAQRMAQELDSYAPLVAMSYNHLYETLLVALAGRKGGYWEAGYGVGQERAVRHLGGRPDTLVFGQTRSANALSVRGFYTHREKLGLKSVSLGPPMLRTRRG
jgi:hypothetical protein